MPRAARPARAMRISSCSSSIPPSSSEVELQLGAERVLRIEHVQLRREVVPVDHQPVAAVEVQVDARREQATGCAVELRGRVAQRGSEEGLDALDAAGGERLEPADGALRADHRVLGHEILRLHDFGDDGDAGPAEAAPGEVGLDGEASFGEGLAERIDEGEVTPAGGGADLEGRARQGLQVETAGDRLGIVVVASVLISAVEHARRIAEPADLAVHLRAELASDVAV